MRTTIIALLTTSALVLAPSAAEAKKGHHRPHHVAAHPVKAHPTLITDYRLCPRPVAGSGHCK